MALWDSIKVKEKDKKISGGTGLFESIEVKPKYVPLNLTDSPTFATRTSTPTTTERGTVDDIKSVAKGTASFLNPKNTGDKNPVNLFDVVKEIPDSLARIVGDPQLRAYGAVGGAIANKLGLDEDLTPEGEFQKDLYGTDRKISLESVGRESRGADPTKESTGIFASIDPALGLIVGSIDAVDGGILGKLKNVIGLSKNARTIIAGSRDVDLIASTLKKEIPQLTDTLANALAKPLTVIDDVNTVDSVLNRTRFQLQEGFKIKESVPEENLFVQHNLTEDNLLHANKLGGLPAPSIAISNKNFPLENFGDITLIGDKGLIDPSIRTNKVYNADAYSKRYPSVVYSAQDLEPLQTIINETKDYFTNLDLPEWRSYDKASSVLGDFENEGRRALVRDFAIQRAFAAKENLDPTSTRYQIEDYVNNPDNRQKFSEFVDQIYTSLDPRERLFKGFTYSGTRRYSEHNLENVLKEMKGVVRDSENSNYGVPSLRASQAKQYRTLDSIKKDRDKIISTEDIRGVKENFEREFNQLLDKHNVENADDFLINLKDYLKGKISSKELQEYPSTKGVDMSDFVDFAKRLKNAPTEYFEVKPQRAVDISEFKYAVVPNTISQKAEKVLLDKGIIVEKFDPSITGSRAATIKRVTEANKLAFGGFAGFEEDEDGGVKFDPIKASVGMFALGVRGKVDINLIKRISESKTVGPIADDLEKAFTSISRRTLEFFAKRLSKLKGTDSITGMLDNLSAIDEEIKARTADGLSTISGKIPSDVPFEAPNYMPQQMADLMTKAERGAYMDRLVKDIKNKEDYAVAAAEYDELFSKVNARAVLRYEELSVERGMLDELLRNDPARELLKYRNRKEGGYDLEEVKGKNLDSKIGELGFKDLRDAQEKLEQFLALRDRFRAIKGELKELRPQVQIAKLLKGYLDDVAVVKDRGVLSVVDTLANTADTRGTYTDISGFEKEALDPNRIFKKFFGPKYKEIDSAILQPFRKSKGAMVDEIDKLAKQIEDNVTKKFNIQRGSKEDTLVREYGEGKKNMQDIINLVGEERAKDIMAADSFFRGWYDKLLDEANGVLAKIYPNNPEKLIPKHSNYYRHLREGSALNDTLQAVKNLFDSPAGIDPKLAGMSERTKPRSKWLAFAQRRIGEKTDTTALEGALDYISSFAYLKHVSPNIANFRYLRRRLAEVAPTPGDPADFGLGKEGGVNNFLVFLDNYANRLAGKSHPLDRWIGDTIPGGRRTINAINFVSNRIKANTVLMNAGSAFAQLANIPAGVASAKQYTIPGLRRTLGGIFKENKAMAESDFLKERKMTPLASQFKISWVDHKVQGTVDRGRDMAAWVLKGMDTVGSNFIWNSHYEKAIAQGIENPVLYADNKTRDLIAGRGIGEVPLGQEASIFKLVAPFTLEVGNLWWIVKDFMKEKDFGALVLLIIGNYIFNEVAEETRGSRVVYDPLNALIEGTVALNEEENKGTGVNKFIGRQAGEFLSNIPLGQQIAGSIDDATVEKVTQEISSGFGLFGEGVALDKQQLFGKGDPGRFGSGWLVFKALKDPIFSFLAPFGGTQFKKTKKGIDSYLDGETSDDKGRTKFAVEQNAVNLVKAILFGENSTDEAQKFYSERDDLFKTLDRQTQARDQLLIDAENKWDELKELGEEKGADAVKAELKNIAEGDEVLAKKIIGIIKDEKMGLTANDRLIKMLGVENGERAKYIFETIKDLDKEEKKAKLKEYATKKILTKDVLSQLVEMNQTQK